MDKGVWIGNMLFLLDLYDGYMYLVLGFICALFVEYRMTISSFLKTMNKEQNKTMCDCPLETS